MERNELDPIAVNDPTDVVEAWADCIFYTDNEGAIQAINGQPLQYLPHPDLKKPFWASLSLETETLTGTLQQFPPLHIHEISDHNGHSFLLRIIPLPTDVIKTGGYVVIATDNRPMEALHENYEERLENNISGWSDSITLFNALFDAAKDATFLIDEIGLILAANTAAQAKHAVPERKLTGEECYKLLGKRFRQALGKALDSLDSGKVWTENVVALDEAGEGFPAEATLRKITFPEYNLFQLIIHDLSIQHELEEDLQETQAEVKEKDIALRHVIQSVEDERKEMREQLTSHVKKQMLPALERITTSDTAEVRERYKTVIHDQLAGLAGDDNWKLDGDMLRLSPREMEVCQLIQLGRSGKEIAILLNMSFETVQTHRKNIRKKLHLNGSQLSLYNYLRTKPSLS